MNPVQTECIRNNSTAGKEVTWG